MSLRTVAAGLVVAILGLAACQQTADISSEPPVIPERSSAASTAASPTATTVEDEAASADELGTQPQPEATPDNSALQPDQASTEEASTADTNPAGLLASSCGDATQLRTDLAAISATISEVANNFPAKVWQCVDTFETNRLLDCFPERTTALFDAISAQVGEEFVAELRAMNLVFCKAGDPAWLET